MSSSTSTVLLPTGIEDEQTQTMPISFSNSKKSTTTVNKLLDVVLPGHTTSLTPSATSSNSQRINSTQKKLNPETVRRLKKKEKLLQRHAVRVNKEGRAQVEAKARYLVLKQHSEEGTLTPEEKVELKKLIKRNVINIQSWKTEHEDDLKEVQKEIEDLKKSEYVRVKRRAPKSKKLEFKQLYDKKQERKFPGLTPGLAPVGMSDSEDESD